MASGNEWPCESDFGWLVELHRSGVLANGDGLTCLDEIRQRGSWISWRYSILKREENKRVSDNELTSDRCRGFQCHDR